MILSREIFKLFKMPSSLSTMKKIHVIVKGKVQGVSFRSTTIVVAEKLQLSGWVKNLPDGNVEVAAEGPENKIEEFLDYLRNGPSLANVKGIEVSEYNKEIEKGFRRLN